MDLTLALLIFAIAGTAVIMFATRTLQPHEGLQVRKLLLLAFALRLVAAAMFAVIPETRIFHEDAGGYEFWGLRIAEGWAGSGPPVPVMETWNQNYGQQMLCAAIYYVIGPIRAAPSFFNALLGTMTVFLVFKLARQFFEFVIARRAAMLTAFTPSMILWSSTALKDPVLTFLICLSLYSCVLFKQRFSFGALAGTLVPAILVQPFRFYMIYFLIFAVLASMFFERGMKAFTGVYKQLIFGSAVVVFLGLMGFAARAEQGVEFLSLERVSSFRQGMASSAESGYASGVDVSTPAGALAFLPIGLSVLLLGPFPWQLSSLRAAMAMPETILWWILFPSMIRGLRFSIRHILSQVSPLVIFSITLTCAYSLVHGNVGSGFRQRAQIFVFLFIFTAVGQYQRVCRRRRVDERLLLRSAQTASEAEAASVVGAAGT